MATVTIKTEDGVTYELMNAHGLTYFATHKRIFPEVGISVHVQMVKHMEIRDDDIYLATYPKSGTHWMWEVIRMLQKGNSEYETAMKESIFLDYKPVGEIADLPSPRVLNCHFPCQLIPLQILEKGNKVVHMQRNIKDVVVSLYNHVCAASKIIGAEPMHFSQFFPLVLGQYGIHYFFSWCKYVKDWDRLQRKFPDQIITINYEDMKEDPVREIHKVNTFLGFNRSDELVREIADACSFNSLKKADEEIKQPNAPDKHKKINFMYRKGEVGDWKNWFTVAQNEMMDAWLDENLVDTELRFRYEL